MSILHSASTIFVDFKNIIANTDLFVCDKLYKSVNGSDKINDHPLHGFFDIINNLGDDYMIEFVNTKKYNNPFKEIIDTTLGDIQSYTDEQIDQFCDSIYDSILYYDYKSSDLFDFQFTNIADALLTLSKDKQLETIYIYVENMTKSIQQSLMDKFENIDKFIIVTGNKPKFLREVDCDLYIFDDIMSIELLPTVISAPKNVAPRNVLFLESISNIDLWNTYFCDHDGSHKTVSERYYIDINIVSVITN